MNVYEIIGFLSGVICVYLVVRENIWNWPVALINAFFYILVFYEARLYADMGLQVIYIIISIYGWYEWLHGGKEHGKLMVTRTGWLEASILLVIGIGGTIGLGMFLSHIPWFWPDLQPAALPYWDALTTAISLIAQWLMARKKLESWVLWILVDIIYIGMYYYKDLYLTLVLYAIFLILATSGLFAWRKSLMQHQPL